VKDRNILFAERSPFRFLDQTPSFTSRTFAFRYSRVGGNPVTHWKNWIPAFAGMTNLRVWRKSWLH